MKKILYIFSIIIGVTLSACSPEEVTINPIEPAAPVLVAAELNTPDVTSFNIIQTTDATVGNETDQAVSLSWKPATSKNDGDILYYVQMDIAGNEFSSAVTIPLAQAGTTELSRSLTFGELNEALSQISVNLLNVASALSINFGKENDLEVRLQTILGAAITKKYSKAINFKVTPYSTELSNEISVKGNALASDVMLVNTDGVYQNRVEFTNSTFRFFAEPSDSNISYNYNYFKSRGYTIDPLLEKANDTEMNFSFTGAEGLWDIVLNTNLKTITLVEVVAPDNLYLVGSLTGWNPATAFPFNNNGDNTFTIKAHLVDGDAFKFLPTNTSWDGAWKEDPSNPGSIINEGGDPNISGYSAGEYQITVDFNSLTFTMKQIDKLYLVGAGVPDAGWGWTSPVELKLQGAIYSGNVNLSPDNGGNFRVFSEHSNWDSGQNYPYYEEKGFTIDSKLVNANDGDSNFKFTGTAGEYLLSIDLENKVISLESPVGGSNCEFDQLWMVGAGVPDAGWGWASPVNFACTGNGVYSASITFANDAFRFFTVKDDWNSGRNYPYYINEGYTIDTNFEDALDGDNNFKFIGTPGAYTLTLDTTNKTISLSSM